MTKLTATMSRKPGQNGALPARVGPYLIVFLLLFQGCQLDPAEGLEPAVVPNDDTTLVQEAPLVLRQLGIPVDGLPTYDERTLHHMTNRIRAGLHCGNASLVCGGAPVRPLAWYSQAGAASHWFARHLHDARCFQHQTCCYLENVGGTVQCDSRGYQCSGGTGNCDDNNCGGSSVAERLSLFGASYTGENIAAGNSTPETTICQWLNSPGHRTNMCNSSHGSLGAGHYPGSNCYRNYWVQNFAGGTPPTGIVSGSHWTDGGTIFGALLYFPGAAGPPQAASVVIDGTCHAMTRELGDDVTGAWRVSLNPGSGCHTYWFLVTGHNSERYAYPSAGSFQAGSGCSGDYTVDRAPAECEGVIPECRIGESRPCYTGPLATRNVGLCREGAEACSEGFFTGVCEGQTLPSQEVCADLLDNDCDGVVDDDCGEVPDGGLPDQGDPDAGDPKTTTDDGCSCRAGHTGGNLPLSGVLLLFALFRFRRKSRKTQAVSACSPSSRA